MVGHRVVAIGTAYAVLAAPLVANAQCKADVDCKGDRVCEQGQCVDPRTKKPDAPPPSPPPPPPKEDDGVKVTIRDVGESAVEDYDTGWALPAGIIGVVAGLGVIGLSIGCAVTVEDSFGLREPIPAVPLGVAAIVLTAAAGPIVFAGSRSAKVGAGASGVKGAMIAGWVTYGIAILVAATLLLYNVADIFEVPEFLIVADGVIGGVSLALFATDAFVAHADASEGAITQGPSLMPTLVWARDYDGGSVPGLGLRASF